MQNVFYFFKLKLAWNQPPMSACSIRTITYLTKTCNSIAAHSFLLLYIKLIPHFTKKDLQTTTLLLLKL